MNCEFESKFDTAVHQTRRHKEVKETEGIAPRILNRCPGLRQLFCFAPWTLYPFQLPKVPIFPSLTVPEVNLDFWKTEKSSYV